MGSKPWRTLSVLVALGALAVGGCNTGPQKDTTIGATAGNPPRNAQAPLQTAPPGANLANQKPFVPPFQPPVGGFSTGVPQANQQAIANAPQGGQIQPNSNVQPATFRPAANPLPSDPLPFSPNLPPIPQQPNFGPSGPAPAGFGPPPPPAAVPPGGFAGDRLPPPAGLQQR